MKRAEKAPRIQAILDELYPDPPIPLQHRDPFTLLVAVALSAQTTDASVNKVTPALFERAPDAATMARMDPDEILAIIRSCGLAPAKARNLQRMAALLVERTGGAVPRSFAELEALPGVGHKTASVVMSQAFGVAAFPVDTHIHRLAWRWGLSDGSSVERTEADLKAIFPESAWNRLHLQIIYFGRQYCPARGHDPEACPICAWASPPSRRRPMNEDAGSAKAKATRPRRPAAPHAAAAERSAAKKSAAKKSTAKKSTAEKSTAKKSAAKKSSTEKSAAVKGPTRAPARPRPPQAPVPQVRSR